MPINGIYTPWELERARKAMDYIQGHYRDNFSVEYLARLTSIDIKLLQEVVQILTGLTVHNFQKKIRLDNAIEDLADFKQSIKSIAYKHGFSTPSHFGAEFKKRLKMSPKDYRVKLLHKEKRL